MAQREETRVDAHEEEREARHGVGGGRGEGADAGDGEGQELPDAEEEGALQVVVPDDAGQELRVGEALGGDEPAGEEEEEGDEGADEPACVK